ncbi:MAG: hypothetical protein JXA90_15495 [Planctomycetes bacterium]|nr:hypothetical protein [Planctomycetota bacterium]
MNHPLGECNLDLVIEMEEMGIGVREIIQYAHGVFDEDDIRALIEGLESQVSEPLAADAS